MFDSRWKKAFLIVFVILLTYSVAGFFGLPLILRYILENNVSEKLNRNIRTEKIQTNPFTLEVRLTGLSVTETDKTPFISTDKLLINFEFLSYLYWGTVIKEFSLDNPKVRIVRLSDGKFNFSDLFPQSSGDTTTEKKGFYPPRLEIRKIEIKEGTVRFVDKNVSVDHRIDNLNVRLTNFSGFPEDVEDFADFNLATEINQANLQLKGKIKAFSETPEIKLELNIDHSDITHYLPYVTLPENLAINSAIWGTETRFTLEKPETESSQIFLKGSLGLSQVSITDSENNPFLNLPQIRVQFEKIDLLNADFHVGQLQISSPEVYIHRLADGSVYLPGVSTNDAEIDSVNQSGSSKSSPVFKIDNVHINKGKIHFNDFADSFKTTVQLDSLLVENVDNRSGSEPAEFKLNGNSATDEKISSNGAFGIDPLLLDATVELADVEIPRYSAYYQKFLNAEMTAGVIDIKTKIQYSKSSTKFYDGILTVSNLKVADSGQQEPVIQMPFLKLDRFSVEMNQHRINMGDVSLRDGHIRVCRLSEGDINLLNMVAERKSENTQQHVATEHQDADPWLLSVPSFSCENYTMVFSDQSLSPTAQVTLDQMRLKTENVTTEKNMTAPVSARFRWEGSGIFTADGKFGIVPFTTELAIEADAVDIRPIQPYLNEQINLILTGGKLNTTGNFKLLSKDNEPPWINYSGEVSVTDFKSVDPQESHNFLKWQSLFVSGLDFSNPPLRLNLEKVSLTDFFSRLMITSQGKSNLEIVLNKSEKKSDSNGAVDKKPNHKAKDPSFQKSGTSETLTGKLVGDIKIHTVTLQNGDIDFSDLYVEPNVNIRMTKVGGRISGLASVKEKKADVLLRGTVGNSPLEISGKINPLIEMPYVDLNFAMGGMDLIPFAPYSGKYLGYKMEKGQLVLRMQYQLADSLLKGKNDLLFKQFTLGESVLSPQSVDLPIKLAIALLKNREGNIAINFPVSGNLNDPEFHISGLIWQAFKNLILKIVSSPFKVLGALVGGGEELSYIDFEPGKDTIGLPQQVEKIEKLSKILFERPQLEMEIQGQVHPEKDSIALRRERFERNLKAIKLNMIIAEGKPAKPLEEIEISPHERAAIVEKAYDASEIPKPMDKSGHEKQLPIEEKEKLLITSIEITTDHLRLLANRRAFNTKDYILKNSENDPGRLYIVEPKIQAGDKTEQLRSMVQFSIR